MRKNLRGRGVDGFNQYRKNLQGKRKDEGVGFRVKMLAFCAGTWYNGLA